MKTIAISGLAAVACLLGALGTAQAQPSEYSFPSQDGSKSPPSTLRITEQQQPGEAAPSSEIRDTPESVSQYQRCRNQVDREAINNAQLQAGVVACLQALEARRAR
ncbi:hypothetical protein [Bordetella sp. BOR01]|uniref:hypothetical protein n=1 Tax=Bordetella sp. BOR01 TaxID=2854779 RepID=UPI001C48D682|nr:hypothetical protein [Bordetella sp. BOR01]MBV7486792.1 hypothetical protein [Bordetella sp. BOR01]